MQKEIKYNGKTITKLSPSGYYEYYSDSEGRFLKFDDLDDAKASIDNEPTKNENRQTKKIKMNELREIIKQIIKEEVIR